MSRFRTSRRPRPPLDTAGLRELGLAYVGKFATTKSKLADYLRRKVAERGWSGTDQPDIDGLVEQFAGSGYVDDEAYALAKSRSLTARGYGAARVRQSLHAAGVDEEDAGPARELAAEQAEEAALRFARRRRIGPFAEEPSDRAAREKAIAALIRAGHSYEIARKVVETP